MTNHYQEIDGPDSQYLMISCPRVLKFEMLILEWGLKVLDKISKDELFSRSTLDEDKESLKRVSASEEKLQSIYQLNIVTKTIYE